MASLYLVTWNKCWNIDCQPRAIFTYSTFRNWKRMWFNDS